MTTVYLAGKMTGLSLEEMSTWRLHAKALLGDDFQILDPSEIEQAEKMTRRAIVDHNKFQIRHSDIVLAELNHESVSIGTLGEIVFARENGKLVITWGKAEKITGHPWVEEHATLHFPDLSSAARYIKDNYR